MVAQIREAHRDDLDQLIRLYKQLNSEDKYPQKVNEVFEQILQQDGLCVFVVEHLQKLISTCYLNVIPNLTRSARPYAIIENVVTDEQMRGNGYGKQLIEYAVQYAWDLDCYKVMLMTGSKKESTHAFYQSCGFDGDEKHAYIIRRPSD